MMKFVSRGDTTVVDAYLSPILRRYVEQVAGEMPGVKLFFMQSSGGLTEARRFQGKDAILSGPAGGIVGMVRTAQAAGHKRLIGFDMGGTSTDVSHYAGEFERAFDTQVAGVRMRAPMMAIHTVAAGGGSIIAFDGARLRVGPESAGAHPGPAAYRRGGPLAVTDANVLLGRIQPAHFPAVFGADGQQRFIGQRADERFASAAQASLHDVEAKYTQGTLPNGLAFADLETSDSLLGLGHHRLLTSNLGQVSHGVVHHLLVRNGFAHTHVQGDLGQTGNLHGRGVAKLGCQLRRHFFAVMLLKTCHAYATLISSPLDL